MTYQLRLTLEDPDVILEYRAQGASEWMFAAGCAFADPERARQEFAAMMELEPGLIRDLFREWRYPLPACLLDKGAVLLMTDRDFVERAYSDHDGTFRVEVADADL